MKLVHHYQFEQFKDEIAVVIDYDYYPAERMEPNPDSPGFGPGNAEDVEISNIYFNFSGVYVSAWHLIGDDLFEEFEEFCLEDYRSGEE